MHKGRLLKAIRGLDLETVRFCLRAEPELLDVQAPNGQGVLQLACGVETSDQEERQRKQVDLVRDLIAHGLDPLVMKPDSCGELSLVWFAAARGRNPILVEELVSRGARPDGLYAACYSEDVVMIELLVRLGVDLEPVVHSHHVGLQRGRE